MKSPKAQIVMIGGLAMKASDFAEVETQLALMGIQTVTFDNLAVGNGPRYSDASIVRQAEHGWFQVDKALGKESKAHLFGISMGGMIAATMATLAPQRVLTLTLGATSPNTTAIPAVPDELYYSWIDVRSPEDLYRCVEIAFGNTTISKNYNLVEGYFQYRLQKRNGQSRSDFKAQLDAIRSFPGEHIYDKLASLDLDTMLISGDEDRLFPSVHSEFIRSHVRRHVEMKQTGHMLHLENPFELAKILADRVSK